jgi:AcrR family transcriptional regulator
MVTGRPDAADPPKRLDRRAARRQETRAEILAAAWDLVRANGLSGLALRDLGAQVGMKAQSLYSYFGSKHEIYDAMFHEGALAFEASFEGPAGGAGSEPIDQLRAIAHRFFEFCTSDPVRYQLLFQRTIPEFVPSDESFAVAVRVYESMGTWFTDLGITDPASLDLWTAMLTGLTDQQISNDPGGDRWERLIGRAVEMTIREIAPDLCPSVKGPQQ